MPLSSPHIASCMLGLSQNRRRANGYKTERKDNSEHAQTVRDFKPKKAPPKANKPKEKA